MKTSNLFIAQQCDQAGECVELEQCIASGQVSAAQIEAHYAAGDIAQPEQTTAVQGAVACNPMCRICVGCGYNACANVAKTTLINTPQPATSAKHWHDLYLQVCQKSKDDAARYGAEIESLEAHSEGDAKDAELLDFLIRKRAYVVSDNCGDGYWLQYNVLCGVTLMQASEHATPREAIRAAIASQKGAA